METLESCKIDKLSAPVDAQKDFVPRYGILYRAMRKWKLAEKVLAGKKLNKSEKQDIYFFLTDKTPPPTKRGRPPKRERDFNLAADYLDELANGAKGNKLQELRNELVEKYCKSSRENTFYVAFKRGRKEIRFFVAEIKKRAKEGTLDDPKRGISMAEDLRIKLENYKKNNPLQKNPQK